jgi:hypothetical protein
MFAGTMAEAHNMVEVVIDGIGERGNSFNQAPQS